MNERSNFENKVIDCLIPNLLIFTIDVLRRAKVNLISGEIADMQKDLKRYVARTAGGNKAVMIKLNTVTVSIITYLAKQKFNTLKVLMMLNEWAFSLHEQGVIDVSPYGEWFQN